MTWRSVDDLIHSLRRQDAEPVAEVCGRCNVRPPRNPGDPVLRCRPCIVRFGAYAGDPVGMQDATKVLALWDAHADVLALGRDSRSYVAWVWLGWTHDPDTLVDEDAAWRTVGEAYAVALGAGL